MKMQQYKSCFFYMSTYVALCNSHRVNDINTAEQVGPMGASLLSNRANLTLLFIGGQL